jgi:amino acid transporter
VNPDQITLRRRLTLVSLIVFGLMYMSPSVVVSTFGVIASASNGAGAAAYAVATLAMFLTALSYAKMAKRHPTSGSVYTYARSELGSHAGFMSGWSLLLDYCFLPMVVWLITSNYMNVMIPAIPVWAWLIINASITTVVNIVGVKVADRMNRTLMIVSLLAIAALVLFMVVTISGKPPVNAVHALWNPDTSVGAITAGAAICAYSFLGFDAVSAMSEEAKNPRRTIPRAIVLTVLLGGALFTVLALLMQWVHPGGVFTNEDTAGYEIAEESGGTTFATVFNTMTIIAGYATNLSIQAGTSRLMYVMGRDGVLPKKVFGRLSERFRTPVINLIIIACTALLAVKLPLATATSFINFGAFLAFTVVNVCVIVAWWKDRQNDVSHSVLGWIVLPLLGAVVDVYLLMQLSGIALVIGACWFVLGLGILTFITRGFRRQPPRMDPDVEEEIESAVA